MSLSRFVVALSVAVASSLPGAARAQHTHVDHSGDHDAIHAAEMKAKAAHMEMTPRRAMTRADSVRAAQIVKELRAGIAKYRDVNVAIEDGFKQFAPRIKDQPVYHFTSNKSAVANAFRFDPAKPTSLLYRND